MKIVAQGSQIEVVERDRSMVGANYRYVKIKNRDGAYDKICAEWELTMFRAGAHTIAARLP